MSDPYAGIGVPVSDPYAGFTTEVTDPDLLRQLNGPRTGYRSPNPYDQFDTVNPLVGPPP
jgi:hypothetical protein